MKISLCDSRYHPETFPTRQNRWKAVLCSDIQTDESCTPRDFKGPDPVLFIYFKSGFHERVSHLFFIFLLLLKQLNHALSVFSMVQFPFSSFISTVAFLRSLVSS